MAWREEGGADFNPVASGLRQFVFQPRLESQRQASLTSQNRNRAGKSVCGRADLPRCLFPTPGLDPRSFALLFPALGKAPVPSDREGFRSAPRTEYATKNGSDLYQPGRIW